ncbi:MAG: Gfo/Idh/MocA family oxidoreductase [Anaerolineae bacterium]
MGDLKAAVIGVGAMGQHHARVYTEIGSTQLVAVADVDPEIGRHIGAKHSVPSYVDYREMLAREMPDVVSVAVPTRLHREVVGAALTAGAHVLVEKPIAATVEEGRAMLEQARNLGRHLMVGHIVRFNPAIQALKARMENGELGRIFQIACRRVGPFPARIRDVGVVVDLATHDLDLMRFVTGEEPARVYAETEQQIHTSHEDLLLALLRFRSGITGMLEINWLTPMKQREVLVLGERGMLRVDDLTQNLYFHENADANGMQWNALSVLKGVSEGRMIRYPLQRYEPLRAELEAFVEAVLQDKPTPVSGDDGLAALRLALAIVDSGRTHTAVEVDA